MDFPETQWTLLAQATLNGNAVGTAAMGEFCRRYREPVFQFLRRRGLAPTDAEDLAHDFLLHVMEKSTLRRADAARGRFRSFLLGALIRYLGDVRERSRAIKRGGGTPPLSLDLDDGVLERAPTDPPDAMVFDREWALELLARTLQGLEADYAERGRAAWWAVLRSFVPGGARTPSYEVGASQAGLKLSTFKTQVHRLRERFRKQLRAEIAATITSPDQVDEELQYLGRVLRDSPPT